MQRDDPRRTSGDSMINDVIPEALREVELAYLFSCKIFRFKLCASRFLQLRLHTGICVQSHYRFWRSFVDFARALDKTTGGLLAVAVAHRLV